MKITTKGRVTIPKKIRDQLDIHPGASVDLTVEGDAVILTPAKSTAPVGKQLLEQMIGKGDVRMSTDEILALTR